MFGHVDYVIQAAPGVGIVSSAVLQSDCLDEIDWEWLGGDDTQVQSNYFGKGITTTYNRGEFHGALNNHDGFKTYSVDWTADQIVWSINGVTVRTLTQSEAATGQYPQTPMMIKVGSWSGGDPSNPPGTIQWAGGDTNYSDGPFTMYLKSIHVSDYSTGSQYTYSGSSGTWESIRSDGGTINPSGYDTPASVSPATSATTYMTATSTSLDGIHAETTSSYVTPSIWPWVGSATATLVTAVSASATVATSYSGLPSGWTVNSSGKVVPPSAGTTTTVPIFVLTICFMAGLLFGYRP
jgi:beta-glucanase (GH16 family)